MANCATLRRGVKLRRWLGVRGWAFDLEQREPAFGGSKTKPWPVDQGFVEQPSQVT